MELVQYTCLPVPILPDNLPGFSTQLPVIKQLNSGTAILVCSTVLAACQIRLMCFFKHA